MAEGAVLDACVLISMSLCDLLLRAAQRDLYRPYWSDLILDETERNLARLLDDPAAARRRIVAMRTAFERALVTGFEATIPNMPNDPKDRHVLATAVASGARSIVTFNLRDFANRGRYQKRIRPIHPDVFLADLFALHPSTLASIIENQAAVLQKGGRRWDADDILDRLDRQQLPTFADRVRRYLRAREGS